MLRVYTQIKSYAYLPVVFILCAMLLTGCSTSGEPWQMITNTGIVTDNPESIPNIAWQTPGQREDLSQQNVDTAATPVAPAPVPAAPAPRKVAVSILLPLSGKKADLGQSMLKAAQMALFDIGSTDFQLIPRDTKGTREGAIAAATDAVNAKNDLILGPIFAEDLKAIKPIVSGSGVPVVSFTTDWTLSGDNTYLMGFLPFIQVARVAKYAQSKGLNRFAVFAPQTEYSDVVVRTLQGSGAPVAHVNRYTSAQADLSSTVKGFLGTPRQVDFDALVLPLGSEGLKTMVAALDVNGIKQPSVRFIGTGLWDDAGLTTNPSLFGGWFAAPDPALRQDFERRFQENFGAAPLRLASLAYDATALAAVLAASPASAEGPVYSRTAMTNPRGFAGIDGIFRFRADGLSERGLAILEIRAGRSVVIDPAPTAFIPSGS